jgi:hypothetical protein
MKTSSKARTNIVVLLAIVSCSAVTMLWLFWRFPIVTAIATLTVLALLGISARLATSTDSDGIADPTEHGKQNAGSH